MSPRWEQSQQHECDEKADLSDNAGEGKTEQRDNGGYAVPLHRNVAEPNGRSQHEIAEKNVRVGPLDPRLVVPDPEREDERDSDDNDAHPWHGRNWRQDTTLRRGNKRCNHRSVRAYFDVPWTANASITAPAWWQWHPTPLRRRVRYQCKLRVPWPRQMLPNLHMWTKLRALGNATEADNYGRGALGGGCKQRSAAAKAVWDAKPMLTCMVSRPTLPRRWGSPLSDLSGLAFVAILMRPWVRGKPLRCCARPDQ